MSPLTDALWADRFAPQTAVRPLLLPSTLLQSSEADKSGMGAQDELAIHPRKVEDVRTWLKEAFEPKLSKYRVRLCDCSHTCTGR